MQELKNEFETGYDVDDSNNEKWKLKAQGQEIEVPAGISDSSSTDLEKLTEYFSKGPSEFFENGEFKNTEPIMDAKNTIQIIEQNCGVMVIQYNDTSYTVWPSLDGEKMIFSVNNTVFETLITQTFLSTNNILITPSTPGHLIHVVYSQWNWHGQDIYQCNAGNENDGNDRYYSVLTGELVYEGFGG